jgi:hypothetical protein
MHLDSRPGAPVRLQLWVASWLVVVVTPKLHVLPCRGSMVTCCTPAQPEIDPCTAGAADAASPARPCAGHERRGEARLQADPRRTGGRRRAGGSRRARERRHVDRRQPASRAP